MQAVPSEILYARSAHGSVPIRVVRPGALRGQPGIFEMLGTGGEVVARHESTRSLLTALTGRRDHGLTFDRYFGIVDHRGLPPAGGSVLDLFMNVALARLTVAPATASRPRPALRAAAVTTSQPELGIDLAARGHEVRKLLFAGFGARIMRSGYDPDEVLQEVYRGILARNRGKCPFDVKKSSFGHYVHMVAECVLLNYHRRESRRHQVEQVGMSTPASMRDEPEGQTGTVDVAAVAERVLVDHHAAGSTAEGLHEALRRLDQHLQKKVSRGLAVDPAAAHVASMLVMGMGRREISQELKVSQARVTEIIGSLREHAADWF